MNRWALVLIAMLLLAGCSMSKMVANNMSGTMTDMKDSFFAEDSAEHAFASGPSMLKMLDGFIVSSPRNVELLQRGAEMNCAFAQTFLEDSHREWAISLYQKGKAYGLRGLEIRYPRLSRAIQAHDEALIKKELESVRKKDQPLLFWTGICWGGEINMVMDATLVPDLPLVEAFMEHSGKLDPSYYFWSLEIFRGTFWAARPPLLGGDPEKGRQHFEVALEKTNGTFLLWKLMFAKVYAVATQNAPLFVETLREVQQSHRTIDNDENRLANQVARRQAAFWLERTTDIFPGYVAPEEDALEEEPAEDLDLE